MPGERVVIDTNELISALLSASSTPALALGRAIAEGLLLASVSTLRELIDKLDSPSFDPYVSRGQRDQLLRRLMPLVEMIQVIQQIRACRDLCDDQFLEVADNGQATCLVSEDRNLLALNPFRGIRILMPAAYLEAPCTNTC